MKTLCRFAIFLGILSFLSLSSCTNETKAYFDVQDGSLGPLALVPGPCDNCLIFTGIPFPPGNGDTVTVNGCNNPSDASFTSIPDLADFLIIDVDCVVTNGLVGEGELVPPCTNFSTDCVANDATYNVFAVKDTPVGDEIVDTLQCCDVKSTSPTTRTTITFF